MKQNFCASLLSAAVMGILGMPGLVSGAGQFQVSQYGDTLLGFRKPGTGSYELVVNIGNITNLESLASGTTVTVSNFTPSQLTAAFADGYKNLSWSVSSGFLGSFGSWAGYQAATIWYTLPRTNVNNQSVAPSRASASTQSGNRQNMLGVGSGAVTISGSLGSSNANNTPFLVREPVWDNTSQIRNDMSYFIDNTGTGPIGSFGLPGLVENTTPASFNTAVRSDLYRSRPTGYTDPQTGSSTGPAYLVGYFQLNPNGTMTFTKSTAATPPSPPPAPKVVAITRSGGTSTIFFTTTNGATYTLFYTNVAGLSRPVTNWPSNPTTITGNGLTNQLSDVSSDAIRFYRVGAH